MSKATKSRYAILGILAHAPGSSGYDLQSIMKGSTDFFWKETFSSIYPVLDALKKERLIVEIESSESGRKRTTYKISKLGQKALQEWLLEDVELEQARNEMLLKIYFGDLTSIDSSIKHIQRYKLRIAERQQFLEHARTTLPREHREDQALPFWLLSIEFGIRRMQASIEWADHALKQLSKLKKTK